MTRRILFCTIGQTPQVVTETVWSLQRQTPPWVPDEIHVVTTTFALGRIRDALQHPTGRLAALFKGGLPPVTIYVPRRDGAPDIYRPIRAPGDWSEPTSSGAGAGAADGAALRDVNSERDAAIMGDLILQLTAQFVQDDETEVHMSLAGGRKTMSAHALLAMTLVARARDKSSHVLVSPTDFEDHPEFWHPDQGGTINPKRRPGEPGPSAFALPLDPKDAHVTLVPTPTPLMRFEVRKAETLEKLRLVDIVNQVNLAATLESDPHVRLVTASNTVVIGKSGSAPSCSRSIGSSRRQDARAGRESGLTGRATNTADGCRYRTSASARHATGRISTNCSYGS
jgi:CRISPR-associated protein (TIGR02584 family)